MTLKLCKCWEICLLRSVLRDEAEKHSVLLVGIQGTDNIKECCGLCVDNGPLHLEDGVFLRAKNWVSDS